MTPPALIVDDELEYVVARLGRPPGRALSDLADAPLDEVLYDAMRLDEVERIDRLVREGDALTAARYTNYAVNDPPKLSKVLADYDATLQRAPYAPVGHVTAAERAKHAAIIASMATHPPTVPV